eukprot:582668-Pyramimonas_sp.AAC.1
MPEGYYKAMVTGEGWTPPVKRRRTDEFDFDASDEEWGCEEDVEDLGEIAENDLGTDSHDEKPDDEVHGVAPKSSA